VRAAYTEQRPAPPAPWRTGSTNPYASGNSPASTQCLADCGPATPARGHSHASAGSTPAGVDGLHETGGNAGKGWTSQPAA